MSHIIAGNQGLRSIQHAAASSTLTFNCLEEEEASLFPIGAPTPTTPTYPVRILHVAYRNRLRGKYLASLFNVAYLGTCCKHVLNLVLLVSYVSQIPNPDMILTMFRHMGDNL